MKLKRTEVDGVPYVESKELVEGTLVQFPNLDGVYKFKKELPFETTVEGLNADGELSMTLLKTLNLVPVEEDSEQKGNYVVEGKLYHSDKPVLKNLLLLMPNREVLKVVDLVKGASKKEPVTVKVQRQAYELLDTVYPVYSHDKDNFGDVTAHSVYKDLSEAFGMVSKLRSNGFKAHM